MRTIFGSKLGWTGLIVFFLISGGTIGQLPGLVSANFNAHLVTPKLAPAAVAVAIFASDCTTPQTVFPLGGTVCAKVTGITPPIANARFDFVDPDGFIQHRGPDVSANGQAASFTIPASGVNAKTGTWKVNIAYNSDSSVIATANFTVIVCPTVALAPATLPNAEIGIAYGQTITANPAGSYTFSIASGTTPPGLTLNPNGTWSGAPTMPGNFTFTISAQEAAGCTGSQTYTITVVCPSFNLSPATLPNAPVGTPYSQQLGATASGTYSFSLTSGLLPTGLSLSASGLISGVPTESGTFNFRVTASNGPCGNFRDYTLVAGCPAIDLAPAILLNGTVGTTYNQTATASGGSAPYTFSLSAGNLPGGVSLASSGALSGTPAAAGIYNFTIKATDANGCFGTQSYGVTINPIGGGGNAGLQFYPLPKPLRLLDTRPGFTGCDAPGALIFGNTPRTQLARRSCEGITIPADAMAITGNITTVQSGGGYLTLYPSDAAQPLVANSNYGPNEIINNVFTVGLGYADGSFKIFVTSPTHVVVDITGYYAPPATANSAISAQSGGLYFHPLPKPIRLLETRAGFKGAFTPGVKLQANAETPQQAHVTYDGVTIPDTALALVGNATTVNGGAGYMTLYPGGVLRPLAVSSNFSAGQVMNAPFTVGLSSSGEFMICSTATTDLVIDVLGYYSPEANDANGPGLLFNSLTTPVRLLETRTGFTGCYTPGAPLLAGSTRQQQGRGLCGGQTIAANALAVVGNATVINNQAGYLTFSPDGAAQPLVATSNFAAGQILNRHFTVGLGAMGMFNIFASAQTDLIVDVSGFFAP